MSGTYRYLGPGRYELRVDRGTGPAGIRRPEGQDVVLGVEGGRRTFSLRRAERVYYWWRGPAPRTGVKLVPREHRELDTTAGLDPEPELDPKLDAKP